MYNRLILNFVPLEMMYIFIVSKNNYDTNLSESDENGEATAILKEKPSCSK